MPGLGSALAGLAGAKRGFGAAFFFARDRDFFPPPRALLAFFLALAARVAAVFLATRTGFRDAFLLAAAVFLGFAFLTLVFLAVAFFRAALFLPVFLLAFFFAAGRFFALFLTTLRLRAGARFFGGRDFIETFLRRVVLTLVSCFSEG